MKEVYALFPHVVDTGAARVVLELGAYRGEDTAHLRGMFPNAHLYSFEPDPRNLEVLRRNGSAEITTLVDVAVGDRDGEATFRLSSAVMSSAPSWVTDPEYSGSSSLKRPAAMVEIHPWLRLDEEITVRMLTLDTFVKTHGIDRIDLVWADVQGAEDLMIAGGQIALARTRFLYTECSEANEYEGQIDLGEMLERLPGRWEVIERFPFDVLLRNLTVLDSSHT